jgi:glyoxylase-like metal-dependent hydrolase (beta-lactamase superfamily II)
VTNKIVPFIVVVATLAVAAQQTPQGPPKPGVPGVQYPMSRITPDAEYSINGSPDWLAMGEDQVWTNSRSIDIVSRMDPYTNKTVAVVPVKNPCSGLVIAHGTLWVPSCTEGVVYRVDTKTNMVAAKVPVPPAHNEGGIAYGAGTIWLPTDPKGLVARIDPTTNGVAARIPVAPGSFTAVFGYGRAWVSSTEKNLVSAIDPATNTVTEIPVDVAPRFMAVGEGFVWTLNQGKGTVTKIDPVAMKVVATIEAGVPGGGGDIAAGEGAVWVTAREIPVTRIDARTSTVTHQFVGPGGDAIRVLHGSVWLSNGRWSNVWRIPANQIASMTPPANMSAAARKAELEAARAVAAKAPNPTGPAQPLSAFVDPGVLPKAWAVSGPNCMEMPAWQVHEYNPNFFILRQSGCIHYEKPFLYLIFGKDMALLEDTGAGQIDSASVVMDLIAKWAKRNNKTGPVPLIVVHSHSHGDHTAGDAGFKDTPNVQFVAATLPELQKAFGIKTWPTDIASIDLGGRLVDVIPIPGHDVASIALYDRQTATLMTGDSVYPGRLYVGEAEFPTFAASVQRLVEFTKDKPVAHILGTHIEQTSTPFVDYPRGTVYQPHEHVLELTRGTLLELNDALIQLNGTLQRVVLRDVILSPRAPRN